MSRYRLITFQGEYGLSEGENLIGSHAYCQVHLPVAGVAGEHVRIDVRRDKVVLTPLAENASTLLGYQLVQEPTTLQPGDRILIGGLALRLAPVAGNGLLRSSLGRWRRIWPWVKVTLLTVLGLTIVGGMTLRAFVNGPWVKAKIESYLQARLKRLVHIEECEVHYLEGAVTLHGLRVDNRSSFRPRPLLRVPRIQVQLPLLSTLLGSLDKRPDMDLQAKAFDVTVFVQRDANGCWNLADLLRDATAGEASLDASTFPQAPLDLGLESLSIDLQVDRLTVLLRDDATAGNLLLQGDLQLKMASLDDPLTYVLRLMPAYGGTVPVISCQGHAQLFQNGRMAPETVRGTLLSVRSKGFDLGLFGRRFPGLAVCRRADLELDVQAKGLRQVDVRGHLRAYALNRRPWRGDRFEPVEGLDAVVDIEMDLDLVDGHVRPLQPDSQVAVVRITHQDGDAAPADLLSLAAALHLEDRGQKQLNCRLDLLTDAGNVTSPALRKAFGMKATLDGRGRLRLATEGNLVEGLSVRLESSASGRLPERKGAFNSELAMEGRLSWSPDGLLETVALNAADGRAAVALADAEPEEVLRVRLERDEPLIIEGLGRSGEPVRASGTLNTVLHGQPLEQWVQRMFSRVGIPPDDLHFQLTAVPVEEAGRFQLKPHVRLAPDDPDDPSGALVLEGVAEFNLPGDHLLATLTLYDQERQAIQQTLECDLRGWLAGKPVLRAGTRTCSQQPGGEPMPARVAAVLSLLRRHGLMGELPVELDGQVLLEAWVEMAPGKPWQTTLEARAPQVALVTQPGRPPVQFDVSTLRFHGAYDPDSGQWAVRDFALHSSLVDLEFDAALLEPSTWRGDLNGRLAVRDVAQAWRLLQWQDLVPRVDRVPGGRATLRANVRSSARRLMVNVEQLEIDSDVLTVRPRQAQLPLALRLPSINDLTHPVTPLPLWVEGEASFVGSARDLGALQTILRGWGLPETVDLQGATAVNGLELHLSSDGPRVQGSLAMRDSREAQLSVETCFGRRMATSGQVEMEGEIYLEPLQLRLAHFAAPVQGGRLTCPHGVVTRGGGGIVLGELPDAPLRLAQVDLNRHLAETWGLPDCAYGRLELIAGLFRIGTLDDLTPWRGTLEVGLGEAVVTAKGLRQLPVLCVLPLVEQHLLMHPDVQKLAGESCRLLGADGQLTFEPGWRARLRLTGDGLRLDRCTIEGPAGQGLQISGWINAKGRMELRGVLYDADVLPRTAATAQRDALRDALDGRSFTIVGMISELPDKLPPILEDLRGEVLAAAAQNASDADDPGQ